MYWSLILHGMHQPQGNCSAPLLNGRMHCITFGFGNRDVYGHAPGNHDDEKYDDDDTNGDRP